MAIVVTASNILVEQHISDWLTYGALTYPAAFLVTDLTNRALGPAAARRVIYAGFALAVALSLVLAATRVALASGTAFMAAQLLDVYVFDRLRNRVWWQAPLVSLEGEWFGPKTIVMEFESEESFRKWYDSPAYQAAARLRATATTARSALVKALG